MMIKATLQLMQLSLLIILHCKLRISDLGTCWIGDFNPQKARDFLNLPEDVEPIAFTPLGYPLDEPKPKTRKAVEDLIRHDTW